MVLLKKQVFYLYTAPFESVYTFQPFYKFQNEQQKHYNLRTDSYTSMWVFGPEKSLLSFLTVNIHVFIISCLSGDHYPLGLYPASWASNLLKDQRKKQNLLFFQKKFICNMVLLSK